MYGETKKKERFVGVNKREMKKSKKEREEEERRKGVEP